jgi:hypothetical protein
VSLSSRRARAEHLGPGGGEAELAAGPAHQQHAQLALQAGERARRGRLRDPEGDPGVGERALIGDRDQAPQVTELHSHAFSV